MCIVLFQSQSQLNRNKGNPIKVSNKKRISTVIIG